MKKEKKKKVIRKEKTSKLKYFFQNLSDDTPKIVKMDILLIGILVLIYGILAFTNLGTTKAPQTYYEFTYSGDDVGLEITNPNAKQEISRIRYFTGPAVGEFTITVSTDGLNFDSITNFESAVPFSWEEIGINWEEMPLDINPKDITAVKFSSTTPGIYLGDVQLYDAYGNKISVKAADDQSIVIADELDTVPAKIGYKNSIYFDEEYFATSAYEYVHGLDAGEWTHPPLGKLIMALPILLFGMMPFTYRFMGALAGLLMIPVIYILAKKLFKNRKWALLAGILMTFDNFHFAHTRMATVDSFLVLFILLAALFMKNYIDLDKKESLKKKARNLLLSGLFMGCAIATKWTGLYAGLALAIVFFAHLFKQYEDKRKTKLNYNNASKAALAALVILSLIPIIVYYLFLLISSSTATTAIFCYYLAVCVIALLILLITLIKKDKKLIKIFLICLIGFVVIPLVIYILSYVLFPNVEMYKNNGIKGIIDQIKEMYGFHSNLADRHVFESAWYKWPAMIKPVWYYVGYYGGNVKSTIVGIGNPIIWWFGILAAIYTLIRTIIKRESENFFIIVFMLCTFVPYIFIGRAMFMYHYFPTLPFVMLAIVSFIKWITEKMKSNSFYIFYVALVIVIFFVFYPVVSGMLTTEDYISALKWLSSWNF